MKLSQIPVGHIAIGHTDPTAGSTMNAIAVYRLSKSGYGVYLTPKYACSLQQFEINVKNFGKQIEPVLVRRVDSVGRKLFLAARFNNLRRGYAKNSGMDNIMSREEHWKIIPSYRRSAYLMLSMTKEYSNVIKI